MSHRQTRTGLLWIFAIAAVAAWAWGRDDPSSTLHEDFEGERTAWRREVTDATVTLQAHERSDRAAHDGRLSERIAFVAGPGSALYYSYPLPKVPISKDLRAQVFVRSNQAGIQLFGRVVLPSDTNPDTGQPSFVLVPGTRSDAAGRWQRLELDDIANATERQARVLRSTSRRPVSLDGAYLEQLVVNVFGGPGDAEVFLDDLTVAPVPEPDPTPREVGRENEAPKARAASAGIKLTQNHLTKDGLLWFFTAIQAQGAVIDDLHRAGFDVWSLPAGADPQTARDAARSGFRLMPTLGLRSDGQSRDPAEVIATATSFPVPEAVAWWNVGENLGSVNDPEARKAEIEQVRAIGAGLRDLPEGSATLLTGGVAGMFPQYAQAGQGLDMIGVHPYAWGSTLEPLDDIQFLKQHRDLTALENPQALHWTWIPATPSSAMMTAIWGREAPEAWGVPQVLPEQIRIFTYAALAAGYRGLGFRAGPEITRPSGKARLIELALLNAEIDLFEAFLAQGEDPIPIVAAYPPDPKVVIIPVTQGAPPKYPRPAKETKPHPSVRVSTIGTRDHKGQLLLIADYAPGSQWQPPQSSLNDLTVLVPAPEDVQFWEVSLGDVRLLDRERVPGGMRITLPDFGPTALVLATNNMLLVDRLKAAVASVRPKAVQMAIEQAEHQYQWVAETHDRLVLWYKEDVRDSADLLRQARETIKSARDAQEREDYPLAWAEARRVGRHLRLLMRAHFDSAFGTLYRVLTPTSPREPSLIPIPRNEPAEALPLLALRPFAPLLSPVSSPGLLSFNTLPIHYRWVQTIREGHFGKNLLPTSKLLGTFEGWTRDDYPVVGLKGSVTAPAKREAKGSRPLKLAVRPIDEKAVDTMTPFQDHPVVAIRSPTVPVTARSLYQIKVKVKMPRPIAAGGGGLIVRDSIGGEPLQFRTTAAVPDWIDLILYRRAPADGDLTVMIGLATGFGDVEVDDVKVQLVYEIDAIPPRRSSESIRPARPPQLGASSPPRASARRNQ